MRHSGQPGAASAPDSVSCQPSVRAPCQSSFGPSLQPPPVGQSVVIAQDHVPRRGIAGLFLVSISSTSRYPLICGTHSSASSGQHEAVLSFGGTWSTEPPLPRSSGGLPAGSPSTALPSASRWNVPQLNVREDRSVRDLTGLDACNRAPNIFLPIQAP